MSKKSFKHAMENLKMRAIPLKKGKGKDDEPQKYRFEPVHPSFFAK